MLIRKKDNNIIYPLHTEIRSKIPLKYLVCVFYLTNVKIERLIGWVFFSYF